MCRRVTGSPCRPRRRPEQGRTTMVKHYIKYAYSTLAAAMFASMA
ncbi:MULTISPECIES: hypothetical protein [unclassified Streptomyces]|nr:MULTISPECIES: hypothetical protein [unclassified Streptomyces]EGJ75315.1 hypothetical protein STTU_2526 [Streptomyces sp. Tu6071]